ncbi:hypothetical protein ACH4S9_30720 [Streptomyces sp. NPDC021225]|uniref:PIN-like domain-containing protein n=1 Tax=Streptomyces sp. NPDC021225 TaxID=3365121 RepID=UPI0037B7AA40
MSRSKRSAGQPADEPPEFLADRSLGRRTVALLREAGWSVRHLGEVYADDGQHVPDEEWIACGLANGWALLTQDERIRYRAHERGALDDGGNPLFYLSKEGPADCGQGAPVPQPTGGHLPSRSPGRSRHLRRLRRPHREEVAVALASDRPRCFSRRRFRMSHNHTPRWS